MATDPANSHNQGMQPVLTDFGSSLRWWRTARRFSQLQLATEAAVSSRHVSFLETGRSRPSREMIVHLSTVLEIPLRDRNDLLQSAGFAPVYSHKDVADPEMETIRRVLRTILDANEPNPAAVVDRKGDLVEANGAALHLLGSLIEPESPALLPTVNLNRIVLHPEGIRERTKDWEQLGATVLHRLEQEMRHRPSDGELRELVDEVLTYEGVPALRHQPSPDVGAGLVIPFRVTTSAGVDLSYISTIATIGAPHDVTVDELRLETFFIVPTT